MEASEFRAETQNLSTKARMPACRKRSIVKESLGEKLPGCGSLKTPRIQQSNT